MVAHQTLTLFVRVRILHPLPMRNPVVSMTTGFFHARLKGVFPYLFPLQMQNTLCYGRYAALHLAGAVLLYGPGHMERWRGLIRITDLGQNKCALLAESAGEVYTGANEGGVTRIIGKDGMDALAAPYVAKYGALIAGQKNHGGTGLTTLTYAAPVVINGATVNVGVAIQFQANGRPRAVNVGLQSGGAFKIDMTKAPKGFFSRVSRYGQGTSLTTLGAFSESISDPEQEVKGDFSQELESIRVLRDENRALRKKVDDWKGQTNGITNIERAIRCYRSHRLRLFSDKC